MPATENAPRHLVLKSGSTTLTLDKDVGKASLRRKVPHVEPEACGDTTFRDNSSQNRRGGGSRLGS
jgi:hypothetical protein